MPHIIVKLQPGRSEELKAKLADKITEAMVETINTDEKKISIDIQEIQPEDWVKRVYKREILAKSESLYKKPGYGFSDEELNKCKSLEEVRGNTNRIDKEIAKLMEERRFFEKEESTFKLEMNK